MRRSTQARVGVIVFAIVALTPLQPASSAEVRTWWNSGRTHSLSASLVDARGDVVQLRLKNGTVVRVLLSKLSDKDQQHIAEAIRKSAAAPGVPADPMAEAADVKNLKDVNAGLRAEIGRLLRRIGQLETEIKLLKQMMQEPGPAPAPPIVRRQPVDPRPQAGQVYIAIGGGHWVSDVSSDGAIVELEDGSTWKIADIDQIDSTLWLTTEDIVVIEGSDGISPFTLINKDAGDKVGASLISTN